MFKKAILFLTCLWGSVWLIAGIVLGAIAYRQISYGVYFIIPLAIFGFVGLVPASFGVLLLRAETWNRRLLWIAVYGVVLGSVFGGSALWRNYYELPRNAGPYLVFSDDPKTTMTVCWSAEEAVAGKIEYALEGSTDWKEAHGAITHFPKVLLEGLEPGKKYQYRVPVLGMEEYTFQTAPASPEDFSFVVYGDNRHAGGISFHRSVLQSIAREEPAHQGFQLMLNSGDIVERPGPGHGWQWHTFLNDIAPFAASRPYEVSLGNHEAGGDPARYDDFFDYGSPTYWRVLHYSGVQFISLSTQDALTPDSPQYAWLVNTLNTPPADTRFTVVTLHRPLLTYDPRGNYNDPIRRNTLEPLFAAKGVDIVFAGHVHAYERHRLMGFDHVITGGGGVLLWSKPVRGPETIKTETCWHFCAVDVRGGTFSVRVVREDGSLLDQFEIFSRRDWSQNTQ